MDGWREVGAEDWVNSCSPGLTKAICRVSASITARCNAAGRGANGEEVDGCKAISEATRCPLKS